ncbi:MAG: hypothetical protein R3C16_00220 [Hyphomonadaceae bacterium]
MIAGLTLWVLAAAVVATVASYLLRPKVRGHYPGGKVRYAAALFVQAAGFLAPIPFVLLILLTQRVWPGLDVALAVAAGVAVVLGLRYLPLVGPLLRDLHRARVEAAADRTGPRS